MSDERIKENIVLIDPMEHYNLIKNNDSQTYQYNFINDDPNNIQIRFIAQKLRNVFNDDNIVQGNLQDLYTHNSPLSVDYGRLSCYLYSAFKKSIEYIEEIKKDNEEMKTIIIDLQNDIIDIKNEIMNIHNILNNKLVIIE